MYLLLSNLPSSTHPSRFLSPTPILSSTITVSFLTSSSRCAFYSAIVHLLPMLDEFLSHHPQFLVTEAEGMGCHFNPEHE